MHEGLTVLLTLILGYLLGSLPNAVWVSRAHGVDILREGSGNPGATNVKRVVGRQAGNLVFALDLIKGLIAAVWPFVPAFYALINVGIAQAWLSLVGLVGALLGHSFSVFIGFRGGKGVATAMGGLLAIMPEVVMAAILVWLMVFYSFRYVSLASLAFAASLPVFSAVCVMSGWVVIRPLSWLEIGIGTGVFMLITIRHRSNIQRLLNGTESRFVRKN